MSTTIQVTVDDDLRKKSDKLFKSLGTDTTSAIRIFLTQAVMYQGFPFKIRMTYNDPFMPLSEEDFYEKLAESRKSAAEGKTIPAGEMIRAMRNKYGL